MTVTPRTDTLNGLQVRAEGLLRLAAKDGAQAGRVAELMELVRRAYSLGKQEGPGVEAVCVSCGCDIVLTGARWVNGDDEAYCMDFDGDSNPGRYHIPEAIPEV